VVVKNGDVIVKAKKSQLVHNKRNALIGRGE